MKTLFKKRSIVNFVLIIMISVFTTGTGVFAFSPRLESPGVKGIYYLNDNPYPAKGRNCTWYAFGRAYEILGHKPNIKKGNANAWWTNNINSRAYPYGTTPQIGAIACWNYGDYGHVAIVEGIKNGKVLISESSYIPAFEFATKEINPSGIKGFQGYIYLPIVAEGDYIIESALSENMVVQTDIWNSGNGANVSLGTYQSGSHQQWSLTRNPDGSYRVISLYSEKALDVEGVSSEDEANIHTWDYVDGNNQKWYIIDCGDGLYQFVSKHSGRKMDVRWALTDEGTNIWQYHSNDTMAQKFRLIPVDTTFGICPVNY